LQFFLTGVYNITGVNNNHDIGFVLRKSLLEFTYRVENYTNLTSNLKFKNLTKFPACFAENQPFSARSQTILPYNSNVKLCSLVIFPAHEDLCFKRCVHLHLGLRPAFPNVSREYILEMLKSVSYYDQLFHYNTPVGWTGITSPFHVVSSTSLRKKNPTIGITIIGDDDDKMLVREEPAVSVLRASVDDTIDLVIFKE